MFSLMFKLKKPAAFEDITVNCKPLNPVYNFYNLL